MSDIAFKSAVELSQLIKNREIGCLELLDHYLARVRKYNGQINAIVVLDEERARARAQEADEALARGEDWGLLHGVPMTCKESFNVAGLPTTFGVPEFKDNIADTDALSVQRLKAAGAVFFGKTNVPLHLADFQSYNDIYGTTNNPWNLKRTPGGSSGGSAAALAAGLTGFEIGSDIGRLHPKSCSLLRCVRPQAHLGASATAGPNAVWKTFPVGPLCHWTPGA